MRCMTCFALFFAAACTGLGAAGDPPPPTVRDAYTLRNGKPERSTRLSDHFQLIFCKAELESWRNAQSPKPDILLYVNGRLMKDTVAPYPESVSDDLKDDKLNKVRDVCGGSAAADANSAAKRADEAAQAARPSEAEKDPAKAAAAKQDFAAKTADATAARAKATEAAQQSGLLALRFFLDPALVAKATTRDAWLEILAKPWEQRPISVSAGTDKDMWPGGGVEIAFERMHLGWLLGWGALFLAAIVLFFRYGTGIIRDSGKLPAGVEGPKAFSLGKTQMALWTFAVAPALAFIFLVTWNASAISPGVLVLMGISFGTTLMSAVADDKTPVPMKSEGFFYDLNNDGTGPSVHRYQMVLFTVILVVIFAVKTIAGLVMPDFDASLLALMGISNGTYVGFKLREQTPPQPPAAPQP